ncbi:MAG: shikimate dehydrogenase [Pseudomonadales bacterium]|nr:shikimate dehydrogenase [Pseudomonadales bacterium]MCP5357778.1 shikimate dehydrogenase [Pseudomonadales bacterium]
MDRYAVFGNPIGHSRSPWIHAQFARQTGQSLVYEAQLVELNGFEQAVQQFFDQGGSGLNITVPFKERAWTMAQRRLGSAQGTGAVNTLFRDAEGQLCGANTDGIGLLRDLTCNHGLDLAGKRILVLGAGGAVKGVMPDLLAQNPGRVCIANRTVARAQAIVETYPETAGFSASSYEDIPPEHFDLIINGSSSGLQGAMPAMPKGLVSADTHCYDMVYGSSETVFQAWAREQGAKMALDGLGMLVEQAAEAFFIWRQVRPQTDSVIADLRSLLGRPA